MMDSVMRTHGFQHLPYAFVGGAGHVNVGVGFFGAINQVSRGGLYHDLNAGSYLAFNLINEQRNGYEIGRAHV